MGIYLFKIISFIWPKTNIFIYLFIIELPRGEINSTPIGLKKEKKERKLKLCHVT